MKRLYYILTLLLPFVLLSNCSKFQEQAFEESSPARVTALMDKAYNTLISSEEGWYFSYFQGWNEERTLGGFWFVCQFDGDDNSVTVASEINLSRQFISFGPDKTPIAFEYPAGDTYTSEWEIIRGRGAMLSFSTYNPILDFFAEPGKNGYEGYEGEYNFVICDVDENMITLQTPRSDKYLYMYRKTDGNSISEAAINLNTLVSPIDKSNSFTAEVKGSYTDGTEYVASARRPIMGLTSDGMRTMRKIRLSYYEVEVGYDDFGQLVENKVKREVSMIYIPKLDGTGITLSEPVTILGNEIKGFSYDADTETFVSDDPNQTVVLKQDVAKFAVEDILGNYNMYALTSFFQSGNVTVPVTISQKEGNLVTLSFAEFGLSNIGVTGDIKFDMTFYPDFNALIRPNGAIVEGVTFTYSDWGMVDAPTYVYSSATSEPIEFRVESENVITPTFDWGLVVTQTMSIITFGSPKFTRQ